MKGTSIYYFFALPLTLVRSPLNIKISKQRCKIKTYFYTYDAKNTNGCTLPNFLFAAGMPQFLFRYKNTILSPTNIPSFPKYVPSQPKI